MYINPVVVGIVGTLLVEVAICMAIGIYCECKSKKK